MPQLRLCSVRPNTYFYPLRNLTPRTIISSL